jgi:hypothetical protein
LQALKLLDSMRRRDCRVRLRNRANRKAREHGGLHFELPGDVADRDAKPL